MKTFNIFLLGLLICFTYSCTEPVKETTVQVDLQQPQLEALTLYSLKQDIIHEFSDDNLKASFPLEGGDFFTLPHKPANGYVYIKPGEAVTIGAVSEKPLLLGAKGDISQENDFLNRYVSAYAELKGKPPYMLFGHEPDSFRIHITDFNKPLYDLYAELEASDMEPGFKEGIANRITTDLWEYFIPYPTFHMYSTGALPELPSGFYEEFEQIDFSQPTHLAFKENLKLAKDWAIRDIQFQDYETVPEYYTAISKRMDSLYGNVGVLQDYYTYLQLVEDINHGNGLDANAQKIAAFEENSQSTVLKKLLQKNNAPWEHLKAGKRAPDFVAETREGKNVTRDSLMGKKLYVDIWATWCAPCLAEIPALKQLEHDLKDEPITFVSISIDTQKDKEKWASFIEQRELGGVQLYTEGAWNSDLVADYNISGIPRFFIIDENGHIINANAPRPSDPKAKEILLN